MWSCPSSFLCWPMTFSKGMFLTNCTSNLLLVRYFYYLFMESIWNKVGYKQLCWTMNNFLMLTKIYWLEALKIKFLPPCFFPIGIFYSISINKGISSYYKSMIKATLLVTCVLFNVEWLFNFQRWGNLIGLLEFHKALSEILLTACAD